MSPLQALAPDQRAIIELLLRQGRSSAELSELLGLPEEGVRTRAHAALAALAPDRAAPVGEDGAVADWLLGQQDEAEAGRTRESVAAIPAWRAWAGDVAERLGEVDGATVPEVPAPPPDGEAEPAAKPERARRPRPVRDGAGAGAADPSPPVATPGGSPAPAVPPAPEPGAPRSSRLGGALLIGVAVVLIGVVLFVLFGRGDDKPSASKGGTNASSTATPTATPQVVSQIALKGVGNRAQGLMQVVKREADGKLVFVLAAEKVPQNKAKEVYAVWFTKTGTAPRNLGYAQAQVGKDGRFATGGPQQGQENDFAKWLTQYTNVVVARASASSGSAKQPGQVVLRGTLPGGQ
jgi:FlaG/FlaF family flagellin (archaellin)